MEAGQVSGVRGERAILAGESMIRPLSLSLLLPPGAPFLLPLCLSLCVQLRIYNSIVFINSSKLTVPGPIFFLIARPALHFAIALHLPIHHPPTHLVAPEREFDVSTSQV